MTRAMIAGLVLATLAAGAAQAGEGQRREIHLLSAAPTRGFAEGVARDFAARSGLPLPIVETAGLDDTYRRFCAGAGLDSPDMMLVSERIDASVRAGCMTNGVTRIAEIKLGYEALVLANKASGAAFDLTPRQVYRALARRLPRGGELLANPFTRWNQIDSRLPDQAIAVIGPVEGSELAAAFQAHFMREGCRAAGLPTRLSPAEKAAACRELRDDGVYRTPQTADYADAIAVLREDPVPLALLPLSLLQRKGEGLASNAVGGVLPTEADIAFGRYPAGNPLHLYVKLQQAAGVEGVTAFAQAIAAQGLSGPEGRLIQQGLVPLPYRDQIHQQIKASGMARH